MLLYKNIVTHIILLYLFLQPLARRFWNAENCVINVRVSDQQNGVVWIGNFSLTNAYLEIPFEITLPRYNATLRYINNKGPADIASSLGITNEGTTSKLLEL